MKEKIGRGYYQAGYGRGFKKAPIVWNINGKAYAKDSANTPYQTDLPGHVMLNVLDAKNNTFSEVGLISEHQRL